MGSGPTNGDTWLIKNNGNDSENMAFAKSTMMLFGRSRAKLVARVARLRQTVIVGTSTTIIGQEPLGVSFV